ncbi:MAG: tRNA (N6-threonylcarbamoyladenosine(37)-N6)-methyltransferase TrmO [Eubacterium sp.]|nr:tRNA (N6-threonylcarbamoyladenosine(37)-N6)-methyltransferase TrmO [Eubacterium sp.]
MGKYLKTIEPIAYIRSDFPEKFGSPRQSGLARTQAEIVFAPGFENPEAVRGLEEFSYIWLIWGFSANEDAAETPQSSAAWKVTVRPPRLGGNTRVGVFASRSPFRPNGLGLSSVRLLSVGTGENGPVLTVEGADLMDGTPIYDIKPYIPYADAHPDAAGGFTDRVPRKTLTVDCPPALLSNIPVNKQEGLLDLLAQDPRPSYQHDPARIYGLSYAGYSVKFTVEDDMLTVRDIFPLTEQQ